MTAQAFPLSWPDNFPRSPRTEKSKFKTSLAGALNNVTTSLQAFGRGSGKTVTEIVLSSNCALGIQRPADPGVAAWFKWDGVTICIPVDRYTTPEENLQAIHHVIEAAYRERAKKAHPDTGGSTDAMAELNRARQEALNG